ncbi:hypothetical protein BaRGS_00011388 [Batillaria attramentaria]|uniref:Uncharacterized protein n=1 Tax=Batillaria attramentaria TaxID=370345 RepID=A0ABD0LCZ6_9CAEN
MSDYTRLHNTSPLCLNHRGHSHVISFCTWKQKINPNRVLLFQSEFSQMSGLPPPPSPPLSSLRLVRRSSHRRRSQFPRPLVNHTRYADSYWLTEVPASHRERVVGAPSSGDH